MRDASCDRVATGRDVARVVWRDVGRCVVPAGIIPVECHCPLGDMRARGRGEGTDVCETDVRTGRGPPGDAARFPRGGGGVPGHVARRHRGLSPGDTRCPWGRGHCLAPDLLGSPAHHGDADGRERRCRARIGCHRPGCDRASSYSCDGERPRRSGPSWPKRAEGTGKWRSRERGHGLTIVSERAS